MFFRVAGWVALFSVACAAYAAEVPEAPATESVSATTASPSPSPEPVSAPPEPVPSDPLHFTISRFQIEGNTLVDSARLQQAVLAFIGAGRDFESIQNAVSAIYEAYAGAGYQTVKVVIPEQSVQDGVVRIQIVESALEQLRVQGNKYFSEANIMRSLPAAGVGHVPDAKAIGENLRLANESFAKQTQITFRPLEQEGRAEGVVRVVDRDPKRYFAMLDNTGTALTGRYRLGLVFQHANLFDLDDQMTLLYQTSPTKPSQVSILNVQYRLPLYEHGAFVEIGAGYSNVDSGTINTAAGNYTVSGSGSSLTWHVIKLLAKSGNLDQRINLGFENRRFHNNVKFVGIANSLVPGIELHPLSLSYQANTQGEALSWNAAVTLVRNIPLGNSPNDPGGKAAFKLGGQRSGANPDYTVLRYNAALNINTEEEWLFRVSLNGQMSRDALVAGEQFGAGGAESVRGFDEREVSNDSGYRISLEAQTPVLYEQEESFWGRVKGVEFIDGAGLSRNKPLPGEAATTHISSVGFGLRSGFSRQGTARLDLADVIDGGGVRQRGKWRVHMGIIYLF